MLLPRLAGKGLGGYTLNTEIEMVVCHVLAVFEAFSKPGAHFSKDNLRDAIDALIKSKFCSMILGCAISSLNSELFFVLLFE